MKVRVVDERDEKSFEVEIEGKKAKIEDVLRKAGINPVTVIVKKNGTIVPVEDFAEDGDVLELLPVVSGG